ncbi:MAG: serine/threonine protein kinase, partial [Chloroflexi bacterium]|nr:serine/threonine protein kinase [Chloroflexota bacterium]
MEQIGRYEVIQELGRGGMAVVYLARDPQFNREVAIKVLPAELTFDPQFSARFAREAQAIASLEHVAILPVYDYGEYEGRPFLVMRYMRGGSLAQHIEAYSRGMPLAETVSIVDRVADALDTAHQRGIIHRDLKPGNILLDERGNPYLADFGIVKLAESSHTLTGSGMIGTPAYMAPEMMNEGSVTALLDVYALGVSLYQMLTGQQPFKAETPIGIIMAHVAKPVPSVLDQRPDLPPPIQTIVARAMAKDPTQRYQSAPEISRDLQRLLLGQPLSLASPPTDSGQTELIPAGGLSGASTGSSFGAMPPPGPQEFDLTRQPPPRTTGRKARRLGWLLPVAVMLMIVLGLAGRAVGSLDFGIGPRWGPV